MATAGSWIRAMRLRTLPLALATVLTGNFIALSSVRFSWIVFSLTILTTVFLQVLSNMANDLGDYLKGSDNEKRLGPARTTQTGEISVKEMKSAIFVFIFLSLMSGISLLLLSKLTNGELLFFFVMGVLAIAAAVLYTIGKRPYGYRAMGDIGVFLFFGIIGVCGSFYLQTGIYFNELLFPATTIGLFSTAVLNMNNMRDIENDRENNKNTLVVLLGWKKARIYHTFLIIGGWFCFLFFFYFINLFNWKVLLFIFPGLIFILNLRKVWTIEKSSELDPELKKIALATFIFSLLFGYVIA